MFNILSWNSNVPSFSCRYLLGQSVSNSPIFSESEAGTTHRHHQGFERRYSEGWSQESWETRERDWSWRVVFIYWSRSHGWVVQNIFQSLSSLSGAFVVTNSSGLELVQARQQLQQHGATWLCCRQEWRDKRWSWRQQQRKRWSFDVRSSGGIIENKKIHFIQFVVLSGSGVWAPGNSVVHDWPLQSWCGQHRASETEQHGADEMFQWYSPRHSHSRQHSSVSLPSDSQSGHCVLCCRWVLTMSDVIIVYIYSFYSFLFIFIHYF